MMQMAPWPLGLLSGGVQAMWGDVTKPANWDWALLMRLLAHFVLHGCRSEGMANNPKRAAQIGKTAGAVSCLIWMFV